MNQDKLFNYLKLFKPTSFREDYEDFIFKAEGSVQAGKFTAAIQIK